MPRSKQCPNSNRKAGRERLRVHNTAFHFCVLLIVSFSNVTQSIPSSLSIRYCHKLGQSRTASIKTKPRVEISTTLFCCPRCQKLMCRQPEKEGMLPPGALSYTLVVLSFACSLFKCCFHDSFRLYGSESAKGNRVNNPKKLK